MTWRCTGRVLSPASPFVATHPRSCKVSGDDQVCETEETRTSCFTFERQRGNPDQVRKRAVGRNHCYHFSVKDGVAKF